MKPYFVLTLLAFILSYKSESTVLPPSGKSSLLLSRFGLIKESSSIEDKTVIQELERLRNALKSKSVYPLLSFFEFPISEENMAVFEEEPALRAQIKRDKGLITKKIFRTNFSKIQELLKMNDLLEVLNTLNIDKINGEEILYLEKKQKEKPCSHIYQIWRENNAVFLLHKFGDLEQTMVVPPVDTESGRTFEGVGLRENHCSDFSFCWKFFLKKGKLVFEHFEMYVE